MLITPKTVYPYRQKDFKSLKDLRTKIEDSLGDIIDQMQPRLTPKQALDLLKIIIKNKETIVHLLSIEIEDEMGTRVVNIFDCK